MRPLFLAFTFAVLCASPAFAQELYACKGDGKISYLTAPTGDNCTRLPSYKRQGKGPITSQVPQTPKRAESPQSANARKNNVSVSKEVQRIRDKKRGQVLIHELKKEVTKYNIIAAHINREVDKKTVNKAKIQRLKERLHIRMQNIKAIQQELARL